MDEDDSESDNVTDLTSGDLSHHRMYSVPCPYCRNKAIVHFPTLIKNAQSRHPLYIT